VILVLVVLEHALAFADLRAAALLANRLLLQESKFLGTSHVDRRWTLWEKVRMAGKRLPKMTTSNENASI
jgi:hypothetical protein